MDAKTRDRLAALIGMLGTDNEHERANAANFLAKKMAAEGISFGELSTIIRGGGSGAERIVYRDVYRDREPGDGDHTKDHKASEIIRHVLKNASATMLIQGQFLNYKEWKFLRDTARQCDMMGAAYRMSYGQSEWLTNLAAKYSSPRAPKMKPGLRKPVPQAMLDELGLTDAAPRGKSESKPTRETDDEIPF